MATEEEGEKATKAKERITPFFFLRVVSFLIVTNLSKRKCLSVPGLLSSNRYLESL